MKNTTKIFILVFILGLVGILGYKFYSMDESDKFKRTVLIPTSSLLLKNFNSSKTFRTNISEEKTNVI